MKKLILVGTAVAALAPAANAGAVTVADPTPNGAFTGTYTTCSSSGCNSNNQQAGYVSADTGGVVACNGAAQADPTGKAGDLQGFIWVGPSHAASNPLTPDPTGTKAAGAGDNQDPATDHNAPCAQQPTPGSVG